MYILSAAVLAFVIFQKISHGVNVKLRVAAAPQIANRIQPCRIVEAPVYITVLANDDQLIYDVSIHVVNLNTT